MERNLLHLLAAHDVNSMADGFAHVRQARCPTNNVCAPQILCGGQMGTSISLLTENRLSKRMLSHKADKNLPPRTEIDQIF